MRIPLFQFTRTPGTQMNPMDYTVRRRFHQLGHTLTLENLLSTDVKEMAPKTMELLKNVSQVVVIGDTLCFLLTLSLLFFYMHHRLMSYIKMMALETSSPRGPSNLWSSLTPSPTMVFLRILTLMNTCNPIWNWMKILKMAAASLLHQKRSFWIMRLVKSSKWICPSKEDGVERRSTAACMII